MNENTINSDLTMGGATGMLLAGRYRVVRQLGQGGMGSVWLAVDEKLDGFKVAIKMLPSVLVNNKRAYAQVKSEALVSLKLSHPNIAMVRAFEEENGNPFLVMDYIDGQTLDDLLAEKGKLAEEETIRLLKPVAAALDYAHAQGVVHRDVKPGNVMIAKDGTPFVLDFGIAREIQETMTRVTGKLSSGTLLYMSPEQLKGDAPKPAQDVYSFAAMAYECLKGEPPFSRGQVEYQILNENPDPLPGGRIACAVMRGLGKDPMLRPTACKDVICAKRGPAGFASDECARTSAGQKTPGVVTENWHILCRTRNARLTALFTHPCAKPVLAVIVGLLAIVASLSWQTSVSASFHRESQVKELAENRSREEEEQLSAIEERVREERLKRQAKEQAEQKEVEQKCQVAERRKAEIADVRNDATVRLAAVRKLSREDGIDGLVAECERQFERAEGEYGAEQWREASCGYAKVVGECKKIAELGRQRDAALAVRGKMSDAFDEARRAGAERFAKNMFARANELLAEGDLARQEKRFEDAARAYRMAFERFDQAGQKAKEAADSLESVASGEKELASLQTTLNRLALERKQSGRIVGVWRSDYCHIVGLKDSPTAKIVCVETLQFDAGGKYCKKIEDLTQSGVSVERGHWKLTGDALTLRPDTGDSAGESESYVLTWTGQNRFEMRLSEYELGKRRAQRSGTVRCLSAYYDSVGVLHEKRTDSRFSNGVYTVQVTPKWYERDASQQKSEGR